MKDSRAADNESMPLDSQSVGSKNNGTMTTTKKDEGTKGGVPQSGVEPKAGYNRISETILKHTSTKLQCPAFCKGKNCKYDSPECWPRDQMAINGVYSHWITNKIIAMARPSSKVIGAYSIIEQFKRHNIKTLINLQDPGEHNRCGPPLTNSGFTYDPQLFMDNQIYYYNFSWKDFGEPTVQQLMDMVKVISFAVTQGKVAVHCHAGLGRTGVLIAAYLVFSLRCKPNDAIIYVRLKRPNAIQTSGQIKCVQKFSKYLDPSFFVFSNIDVIIKDFSIHEYLKRQKRILHGYEARHLKHIPKLVYIVGERLLELANCAHGIRNRRSSDSGVTRCASTEISYELDGDAFSNYFLSAESKDEVSIYRPNSQLSTSDHEDEIDCDTPSPRNDVTSPNTISSSTSSSRRASLSRSVQVPMGDNDDDDEENVNAILSSDETDSLSQNTCFQELSSKLNVRREVETPVDPIIIANALLDDYILRDDDFKRTLRQYQKDLNTKGNIWIQLSCETDAHMLAAILWSWLEHLGEPVLATRDLSVIVTHSMKPVETLARLDRGTRYTTEYVLRFVARLQPLSTEVKQRLLRRSIAALTKQGIPIDGVLKPFGVAWHKMREGTLKKVLQFINGIFQAVSNETVFSDDSDND